ELVGERHPFRLPYRGRALGRYLERHASRIAANSNASASRLRDEISNGNIPIDAVPNGIDFATLGLNGRRADKNRPLVVAMIGNLTSRTKKHALFVDAARALAN